MGPVAVVVAVVLGGGGGGSGGDHPPPQRSTFLIVFWQSGRRTRHLPVQIARREQDIKLPETASEISTRFGTTKGEFRGETITTIKRKSLEIHWEDDTG